MTTISYPHKTKKQISTLDFQKVAIISYMLRALGAVIFGGLFYAAANAIHPDAGLTFESLVTIAISDIPDVVSIGLIIFVVIFVLWLHELIHASAFYLHSGAPPRIGIRGPIIFASAEGYLNTRSAMLVNALAPFVVISALGLLLIAIAPVTALAWVFIPTVANAAAAGGDFMAVFWLLGLPRATKIEDHGDLLIAYDPSKYTRQ
ncbi:MAG: DUF3267 domain-containing protein [Aggregatilineales bacterium]